MKFSAVFAGAFAALATAAPATTPALKERAIDLNLLNNLAFQQVDLTYLLNLNALDLVLLQNLGLQNGLDVLAFQNLFNAQVFDVQALLQFQQLQTLLSIAQTGALNAVDLSLLQLGNIDLGLINGIAGVNLAQFINKANVPQIQVIAGGVAPPAVIVKAA